MARMIQIDDQHWDLYEGGGESAEDALSRIMEAMTAGGLVTIRVGLNGDPVTYNAARITWVRLNPIQIKGG